MENPISGKSHHRGVLLLAVAALGGAALAVWWLTRGRRPLMEREDWIVESAGDASPSFFKDPEPEIDVTSGDDVDEQAQPSRTAGLIDIEGIGPTYVARLEACGVRTTDDLLLAGATPKGREDLAAATGISGKLILRWVNHADLFRVKGVGGQYADLLEAAGVDTVPELAQRRADNLTKKMAEINEQKRLVRRLPTEAQVAAWIDVAQDLPRVVTY